MSFSTESVMQYGGTFFPSGCGVIVNMAALSFHQVAV